jgi:uncharacterized protein YlzI (FlbEa/FlbD family)
VEEKGKKMDAETKKKLENRLNAEITKLRDETNQSVNRISLENKAAREQMKKEMQYAITEAAKSAKQDLEDAIKASKKRMDDFQLKAANVHADSAAAREVLKEEMNANAVQVSNMIKDAVSADAKAQTALAIETAKAIDKTNAEADAYAQQMKDNAKKARDDIKLQAGSILHTLAEDKAKVQQDLDTLTEEDAARRKATADFLEEELKKAGEASEKKFGAAYEQLAEDRASADKQLSNAVEGMNDALAKQAALEDSRFTKTVSNIAAAKKQASEQVVEMRKEFATQLVLTTSLAKNTENKIMGLVEKVSGEVISLKAHQVEVNKKVQEEKDRIEKLANKRYSEDKRARGKLRDLINANKKAAAAEVDALTAQINEKIDKARARNAHNKREMAKDLTRATKTFYGKLAKQAEADQAATDALNGATETARLSAEDSLSKAKKDFESKIVYLSDTVAQNAKAAERAITRMTGVVHDYADASAQDRTKIKDSVQALEADLNKALDRAISMGEAKAKAVQQRIAAHLNGTQKFLQTELSESVENAADEVFKMIEGKRSTIADNYLSLKAYAAAGEDAISAYVAEGKGRALSSIGDLLTTLGGLADVNPKAVEGLGMGGDTIPAVFSGDKIKVSGSVSVINGLVDEFTEAVGQVRNRWPMGLGKYLLDKVEASVLAKGVLQVDKIEGKSGNWVFLNALACGLSNKLTTFKELAVRMPAYEAALSKLSAKITLPEKAAPSPKSYSVPEGEFGQDGWQGSR